MVEVSRRSPGSGSALSWAVDAAIAGAVVVAFWVPSLATTHDRGRLVLGACLVLTLFVSVLLRWKLPGVTTVVAFGATMAGWVAGVNADPMLAAAWCLYPLALRRGSRTRVIGLIAVGALMSTAVVLGLPSEDAATGQRVVIAICALGASWLLGHVEAQRLEATRRTVREQEENERSRQQAAMAREVHDVVGHALSVISAEADVARHLPDADERELRESLADVERRARGALEEVQTLVRALRAGRTSVEGVDPRPASTLLPGLVAAARVSGVETATRIDLPEVAWETDRVAVRVVQEALSNVVRHSGASRCELSVWPEGGVLVVRIDDDGAGLPPAVRPGTGLTGMRERVEQAGGELTVTNRLEGGTRVLARLPLEAVS